MKKIVILAIVLVSMTACKRHAFDYSRTSAPEGSPKYTYDPDINQPGVSKPVEESK